LTVPVVEGTIVVMDLDRFGEEVESKGLSEYSPNIATGTLTLLVESLVSKWSALVLYGLDRGRGTEEAVLLFPGVEPGELEGDLVSIARELEGLGFSITIVALRAPIASYKPLKRRRLEDAYYKRAKRLLDSLKKRGGGVVFVEDRVAYRSRLSRVRPPPGP
jgi:hypothetical protein